MRLSEVPRFIKQLFLNPNERVIIELILFGILSQIVFFSFENGFLEKMSSLIFIEKFFDKSIVAAVTTLIGSVAITSAFEIALNSFKDLFFIYSVHYNGTLAKNLYQGVVNLLTRSHLSHNLSQQPIINEDCYSRIDKNSIKNFIANSRQTDEIIKYGDKINLLLDQLLSIRETKTNMQIHEIIDFVFKDPILIESRFKLIRQLQYFNALTFATKQDLRLSSNLDYTPQALTNLIRDSLIEYMNEHYKREYFSLRAAQTSQGEYTKKIENKPIGLCRMM